MLAYNIKLNNDQITSVDIILDGNLKNIKNGDLIFNQVLKVIFNSENVSDDEKKTNLLKILGQKETLLCRDGVESLYYTSNSLVFYKCSEKFEFKSKKFLDKVKRLNKIGVDIKYILKFCKNLSENPSEQSKNMLFDFLEHNDIAINTSGNFLGYKSVRRNLYDAHSETILYTPDSIVEMSRGQVDIDPNNHCSSGLHVGSFQYAKCFSEVMLLVEVNPRDVVSVPNDHNCQKLRCCKLKVISILENNVSLNESCYDENIQEVEKTCFNVEENDLKKSLIVDKDQHVNVPLRDPKTGRFLPKNKH